MARRGGGDLPDLGEAWGIIGRELGLGVTVRGERSVRAEGVVRGRPVVVDIDVNKKGSDFIRMFTDQRRNRLHERWTTLLSVGCSNPRGVAGKIASLIDVESPDWDPRDSDGRKGRVVRADPADLIDVATTPAVRDRLANLSWISVEIEVGAGEVAIREQQRRARDAGYIGGSIIHFPPGPVDPTPRRAVSGPPWWIDLLCDIADAVDR